MKARGVIDPREHLSQTLCRRGSQRAEEQRVVMNDNSANPAKRLRKVVEPDEEKEKEQSDDTDAGSGSEKLQA